MDMDDNGSMEMSMVMTFGSWSDYQLKLIFDTWDITTKWEFAIAWFGVVLAAVLYHGMRHVITAVEFEIKQISLRSFANGETSETTLLNPNNKVRINNSELPSSAKLKLKLFHAILSAMNYALALLLMLVAMTYNLSFFLALIVGYFIGDLLFYHDRDITSSISSAVDSGGCH